MTMLRDNKDSGAERQLSSHNVLGEPPEICSMRPMTGFYRDGCCKYRTRRCWQSYGLRRDDKRVSRFFKIARQRSFDPVPELGFPGLKPGDRWCLCAPRWQEAFETMPPVSSCANGAALSYCSLADLKRLAIDLA